MAHQPAKPQIHAYSVAFLVWALLMPLVMPAQNGFALQTSSKKALKSYQKAETDYRNADFTDAEAHLLLATAADAAFIEAWLMLGDVSLELKKNDQAIEAYQAALSIDSLFYPPAAYILSNLYLGKMEFEATKSVLKPLLQNPSIKPELQLRALETYQKADFRQKAMQNPVAFNPLTLGDSINTTADEYINAVRLDGKLLLFTRRFADSSHTGKQLQEQLFESIWQEKGWSVATEMILKWPLNEQLGALNLSADGRSLYFAACDWPGGSGSCDLFVSHLIGQQWSLPSSLGTKINSAGWESQPCLSADGQTLYFSSRRKGGYGGSDLYKSILLPDGSWSAPVNLGDKINSSGNEMAPFIHPDGNSLYFSSDGLIGMGGTDLFMSRMDEAGRWQKPVNMGFPLNTADDEINLLVSPDGLTAFLSAAKSDGKGGYDVYTFELDSAFRSEPVAYVQLLVRDARTKSAVEARVSLTDPTTGAVLQATQTALPEGDALVVLSSSQNFTLEVSKDGYLYYSNFFEAVSGTDAKPAQIEVLLDAVETGKRTILKNILFAYNKTDLQENAYSGLQILLNFLATNPTMSVSLEGHTDSIGSAAWNKQLSLGRAEAVRQWLLEKGIGQERIKVVGWGSEKPLASNETEAGRARNRRTEMVVLDF